MLKTFTLLFACCCLLSAKSQAPVISKTAASVPESLKKNAAAVYRLDEALLNITSPSEYTMKVHQVITILNSEGSHYLRHGFGFDKFHKVEDVSIKMYDEAGNLKRQWGKKDFEIESPYDGMSLVTDDKLMRLYTPATNYPCTIEVESQVKVSGYIELPNWYSNTNDAATEVFRYEVIVPAEIDIRHRTLNMTATPSVENIDKKKKYVWEVKNIEARKYENDGFEPARYLPQIEVAPQQFSYDGYKGNFASWSDFGAWNYPLYEDKAPFTPERIAQIKALITNAKTRSEKIEILYHYLQRSMRYVSIQLGIGGFKPFAVKFVDDKKYGDCKALTNYMRHLLMIADIISYPALINAGNDKIPVDPQFPSDPFNHVILCVPGGKDTTWLECTSNDNDPGELGTFTENKKALLLTEKGGILVNTPVSIYKSNRLSITNEVKLTGDGGAEVSSKISGSGEPASLIKYMSQLKDDEQKEMMINYFHYKHPEEQAVTYANQVLSATSGYSKLYEFATGGKYFFTLSVSKLANRNLKAAMRETDYLFNYPFEKTDTTTFLLAAFTPETIPANKELSTDYSVYKRSFNYDKASNKLVVTSYLALKTHVVPATAYPKVVQFFKQVVQAEDENMVFMRSKDAAF